MMRSKLFVPGVRPEFFTKALASNADAISVDLEDAVPEEHKAAARAAALAFVTSDAARCAAKIIIVRVNGLASPYFEADLLAVARTGLTLLNLPKVESADDVRVAVAALERAEAANRVERPIRLLLNIETPKGLRAAGAIAGAHERVFGLQLGLGDLFEPHRIARRDVANVHAVMFALRMAAAEAGVLAVDGAFADVADADGYLAEAQMAQRLGFVGKSCIHPSQVALAHQVFRPSGVQIEHARRVVEAGRAAAAQGRGAFMVDGCMVDLPFLKHAEALLAAGQISTGS